MTVFLIKTMKIHYVLKGINGNPCTKMTKNGNNKKHILRFYEIHSDHLDANMIRSSRSNGETHTRIKKQGYNNKRRSLQRHRFTAGSPLEVVEMCTSPERKGPDVVHLAQQ